MTASDLIDRLAEHKTLGTAPRAELEKTEGDLPRKLDPEAAKSLQLERIVVDKAAFKKMHAEDRMATDKLKEGIDGFSAALVNLEKLVGRGRFRFIGFPLKIRGGTGSPIRAVAWLD